MASGAGSHEAEDPSPHNKNATIKASYPDVPFDIDALSKDPIFLRISFGFSRTELLSERYPR